MNHYLYSFDWLNLEDNIAEHRCAIVPAEDSYRAFRKLVEYYNSREGFIDTETLKEEKIEDIDSFRDLSYLDLC